MVLHRRERYACHLALNMTVCASVDLNTQSDGEKVVRRTLNGFHIAAGYMYCDNSPKMSHG